MDSKLCELSYLIARFNPVSPKAVHLPHNDNVESAGLCLSKHFQILSPVGLEPRLKVLVLFQDCQVSGLTVPKTFRFLSAKAGPIPLVKRRDSEIKRRSAFHGHALSKDDGLDYHAVH
jgi:hypothetical protein